MARQSLRHGRLPLAAGFLVLRTIRELRRPLLAALVLVAGIAVLSTATALLGNRGGDASFALALEDARRSGATLHAVPVAVSDAGLEAALARLKAGPFGVDLRAGGEAAAPAGIFAAAVLIDAARPPLQVEIMGLGLAGPRPRAAPADRAAAP